LVQAELERQGICSVSLTLLKEITKKVRTPKSLFVPFAHGFALEEAHNFPLQQAIIMRMLKIMYLENLQIPYLEDY
jgi:hypothetical protein